jgi:hypothetical protein
MVTLKKYAEGLGIELKLSVAQNAVAKIYGYRAFKELISSIGQDVPTLMDDDVDSGKVQERRAYQVHALAEALDIDEHQAEKIISYLSPTSGSSSYRQFSPRSAPPVVVVIHKTKATRNHSIGPRIFDLTNSG